VLEFTVKHVVFAGDAVGFEEEGEDGEVGLGVVGWCC